LLARLPVEQGDEGDSFFIIVSGEAVVTKTITVENEDGTTDEEVVEVNRLHKGDYFGELALLTNRPRAATVTAVGDVDCIRLTNQGAHGSAQTQLGLINELTHTRTRSMAC